VAERHEQDDTLPVGARAVEWLWTFGTKQVDRRWGWLAPCILAPVVYFVFWYLLMLGPEFWFNGLVLVGVGLILVLTVALFWSVYRALWKGETLWMKARWAPLVAILWSIGLWLLALAFFAPISTGMYDASFLGSPEDSGLTYQPEVGSGIFRTQWEFARLYGWHAIDAIPGLDAAKTLTLEDPPVQHYDARLGGMLLLYKAAFLIPLIAAYRGVWTARRPEPGQAVTVVAPPA
jgi:hypothetical protein